MRVWNVHRVPTCITCAGVRLVRNADESRWSELLRQPTHCRRSVFKTLSLAFLLSVSLVSSAFLCLLYPSVALANLYLYLPLVFFSLFRVWFLDRDVFFCSLLRYTY